MSIESDEIQPDDLGLHSWRHMIPPESWAQQCHDTSMEYFLARVRVMDSAEHLRAALDREVNRDEPRPDRVGKINKRLQEVDS